MVGWGIFLIIIGAGSLLLPSLGFQFRLMELVDDLQPYAGMVIAVVGAALLFLGMTRGSQTTIAAGQPPPASSAADGATEVASDDPSRT